MEQLERDLEADLAVMEGEEEEDGEGSENGENTVDISTRNEKEKKLDDKKEIALAVVKIDYDREDFVRQDLDDEHYSQLKGKNKTKQKPKTKTIELN